jgi:hypothetical protein
MALLRRVNKPLNRRRLEVILTGVLGLPRDWTVATDMTATNRSKLSERRLSAPDARVR